MAFSDDFNDNSINPALWNIQSAGGGTPANQVKEQNQRLELFPDISIPSTAAGVFSVDIETPVIGVYHEVDVQVPALFPNSVGISAGLRLGPVYVEPLTHYASLVLNNYTGKIVAYLPGVGWTNIADFTSPGVSQKLKIALIAGGVEYYVDDVLLYTHNVAVTNDYYIGLFSDFLGTNPASFAILDNFVSTAVPSVPAVPRTEWGYTWIGLIGPNEDWGQLLPKAPQIPFPIWFTPSSEDTILFDGESQSVIEFSVESTP